MANNQVPGLQITAANPNVGGTGATSGAFTIAQVLQDALLPSQVLDIIGDGSGNLGKLCSSSDGSDPLSTSSSTPCFCTYQYTSAQNPSQNIDVPVIYHESNIVRCTYGGAIPSGVTSFTVSIHYKTTNVYSNALTFNYSGSGTPIDPTLANSFQKVTRNLCKSSVKISYLFDSNIYDPIQSEDPHFTYPLDYYSNNLGGSLEYFVNSGDTANTCPAIPDSSIPIFSKTPLNGNPVIDPPIPRSVDRATFYLAKQPTGIFTQPLNAVLAPSVVSDGDSTGSFTRAPPLGYGASHISIGSSAQETCPTSTSIPSGYQWVKVWLFRAALAPRSTLIPNNAGANTSLTSIVCNPGDWNTAQPGDPISLAPVFTGCGLTHTHNSSSPTYSLAEVNSTGYLADRVLGSSQCVQMSSRTVGLTTTVSASFLSPNSCSQTPTTAPSPGVGCGWNANLPQMGGDFWNLYVPNPSASPYAGVSAVGCNATPKNDPLGLCKAGMSYSSGGSSFAQPLFTNLTASPPFDTTQRYDFIFVVTPVNIYQADILNTTANSIGTQYYPFRYLTAADCQSPNPNNPLTPTDCQLQYAITNYFPKLHDIQSNGDPPANATSTSSIFPVCALQKIQ
jgi:hypothetical protein